MVLATLGQVVIAASCLLIGREVLLGISVNSKVKARPGFCSGLLGGWGSSKNTVF